MADFSYEAFRAKVDEDSFIPSSAYVVGGVDVLRVLYDDCMQNSWDLGIGQAFEEMFEFLRECSQMVALHGADFLGDHVSKEDLAVYSLYRIGGDPILTVLDSVPSDYQSTIRRGWGDFRTAMRDPDPAVPFICCLRVLDSADFFSYFENDYAQNGGKRLVFAFEASVQYESMENCISIVKERFGDIALLSEMQSQYDEWDKSFKSAEARTRGIK